MEYKFKSFGLFGFKETTLVLEDDVIIIHSQGNPETTFPYCRIESIQLLHNPSKNDWNRFLCIIKTLDGLKTKVSNMSIVNISDSEDHSSEYKSVLVRLHERLINYSCEVKYYAGYKIKEYLFYFLFYISFLLGMAFLFSTSTNEVFSHTLAISFLVISWGLFIYFTLKRNYPRKYDPTELPLKLMPK